VDGHVLVCLLDHGLYQRRIVTLQTSTSKPRIRCLSMCFLATTLLLMSRIIQRIFTCLPAHLRNAAGRKPNHTAGICTPGCMGGVRYLPSLASSNTQHSHGAKFGSGGQHYSRSRYIQVSLRHAQLHSVPLVVSCENPLQFGGFIQWSSC